MLPEPIREILALGVHLVDDEGLAARGDDRVVAGAAPGHEIQGVLGGFGLRDRRRREQAPELPARGAEVLALEVVLVQAGCQDRLGIAVVLPLHHVGDANGAAARLDLDQREGGSAEAETDRALDLRVRWQTAHDSGNSYTTTLPPRRAAEKRRTLQAVQDSASTGGSRFSRSNQTATLSPASGG